jgi:16S rRNA (cytosine1402-N4)-methyltransferase
MSTTLAHDPVMLGECLEALAVAANAWYLDGTFGAGGHSRALLQAGARVLAIDQDPAAWRHAEALAAPPERFKLVIANFRDMARVVVEAGNPAIQGILLDLGVSSMQIDTPERGFAFRHDGPLDMRMSGAGPSAAELVNTLPEDELAAILYRYGEERHSRRIARAIARARDEAPITTTSQLVEIVQRAYPPGKRRDHPARRTFQALRIAVNDELAALEAALEAAERVLKPAGRLVVISYHSLEDRIVKRTLRASGALEPLNKRPLTASLEEIARNPRARSAKLRAARKRDATTRKERDE